MSEVSISIPRIVKMVAGPSHCVRRNLNSQPVKGLKDSCHQCPMVL